MNSRAQRVAWRRIKGCGDVEENVDFYPFMNYLYVEEYNSTLRQSPRPPPHPPHPTSPQIPSSRWFCKQFEQDINWGKFGDGSRRTTGSSALPDPAGSSRRIGRKGSHILPSSCTSRTPQLPPCCGWARSPSAPPPMIGTDRHA